MKKVLSLALVAALLIVTASVAFADSTTTHTITIANTAQHVSHTYTAYQVFTGDGAGTKLSNVEWGRNVDGAAIMTALNTLSSTDSLYALKTAIAGLDSNVAADVEKAAAKIAEALTAFSSTNATPTTAAGALDDFAALVAANLNSVAGVSIAATTGDNYAGTVTGDGYYLIKDSTATLTSATGSDTLSKHILIPVLDDVTVNAKDDHFTPEKKINDGTNLVDENSAAVGDVVDFVVTIPVPNTTKYQKGFAFEMNDTLPKGLTFMGIDSITVVDSTGTVVTGGTLVAADYTVTVAEPNYTNDPVTYGTYAAYTAPSAAADAVTVEGGEKIKVVFNNFKTKAEANSNAWINNTLKICYHAVVNKYADFTPTGNINTVSFDYANDPNSAYNGTNPNPPMGTTPEDTTKTLLINLEISKKANAADGADLAGAVFEISSTNYNVTLVNGEKYVEDTTTNPYTVDTANGEALSGTAKSYYKLKDGTYTTTAPAADGSTDTYYDSTTTTYSRITFSHSVVTPSGTPKKVTVTTDANGKIKLEGLDAGTYEIKEIQAPNGYNLDSTVYTIKVDWNGTAFVLDSANSTSGVTFNASTTATASITIVNKSGVELPSTGGIGTTIFYVSGLIMVMGAAVILVARRRADAE